MRILVAIALALFLQPAFAQERYSPSIRVIHAQQFIEVTSLLQQGRTADAWAKFQQYAVNMGHLGGALDSQLPTDPVGPIDVRTMPWGQQPGRWVLTGFGMQTVAFRLDVPADAVGSSTGYTSIFEYQGPPALRVMSVSTVPGAFPGLFETGGVQAKIAWGLAPGGDVVLERGRTYYFNVRNFDQSGTNLPAMVETLWPRVQ